MQPPADDAPVPLSKLPNFDPRTARLLGVDAQLPPVPPERLRPAAMQQRFNAPPVWEPEFRVEPRYGNRAFMPAAVLIAIVDREEPTVLLTQRTAHLSNHSGQIAFPGGRQDPEDADIASTALREAHEEIGLAASDVQVIGALPTYTTVTAFVVTPVVGLVRPGFAVQRNPYEVDDIFEVPLAFLMNPANHQRHAFEVDGMRREWLSMPYPDGGTERFIWGATAGMLRNLYRFLSA